MSMCKEKNYVLCHKIKLSNPYIFATPESAMKPSIEFKMGYIKIFKISLGLDTDLKNIFRFR